MDAQLEARILQSWHRNAEAWSTAVRTQAIASRCQVTDAAILAAVTRWHPRSVLDIGCGEGWLARELSLHGIAVTGIDATAKLIELAREAGGATYACMTYDQLSRNDLGCRFDMAVCNFSLLGQDSTGTVIKAVPDLLEPGGRLAIQTLHPAALEDEQTIPLDGWRKGSWAGCGEGFLDPSPWYFRTPRSWTSLFRDAGLKLVERREPRHPETGKPVSLLFIAART